jgi:hypothetical protein
MTDAGVGFVPESEEMLVGGERSNTAG